MQKISSYLYPNRIELLVDLAGFTVEYTNVYQRTIKIYNGIDNTIEFDIKNADQKRIDLSTLTGIELNIMDVNGTALPNSPYTVAPTAIKGIATVTIPEEDLTDLNSQFLKYSVTALKDGADVLLYADSRFGAIGKIELVGDALPTFRNPREFKTYTGEIDLVGNVINHFPAISTGFYEAVTTETLDFDIYITGFIGTIWIQGTTNDTISVNSYLNAPKLYTYTAAVATTTIVSFNDVPIGDYSYFRVSFQGDNPLTPTGKVDKVVVD
jgi:hypothetical protein